MKKITTILFFFSTIYATSQINPVENLIWNQWYYGFENYFNLEWEEPEQPHDNIIGYNVYRENDFFIFTTDTSIYYTECTAFPGCDTNCGGGGFIALGGFMANVTAVYESQIESEPQSVQTYGPALGVKNKKLESVLLFPNPTYGIVNIEAKNLNTILLFDIRGKFLKEYGPNKKINLAEFSKGIYFLKLISEEATRVDKIILK